jgi:ParB-like chromosome segregation protein Spo0J
MQNKVKISFKMEPLLIPLDRLLPTMAPPKTVLRQCKYKQILASVREVGIIEPVMVYPSKRNSQRGKADPEEYMILDGHLRVMALKELGKDSAPCLISTDDEGYTYNRIVNRMCTIQEHYMVLRALEAKISEERIAQVLDLDVQKIRAKRDLLNGLCPEAVELLKNKDITAKALRYFKRVKPIRQIEMAELMVAVSNYTKPYAQALYLACPQEQLLDMDKGKAAEGISPADIARMEKEMRAFEQALPQIKDAYAENVLNLTVARNYMASLLANERIVRFLSQHEPEILTEFQRITALENLEE